MAERPHDTQAAPRGPGVLPWAGELVWLNLLGAQAFTAITTASGADWPTVCVVDVWGSAAALASLRPGAKRPVCCYARAHGPVHAESLACALLQTGAFAALLLLDAQDLTLTSQAKRPDAPPDLVRLARRGGATVFGARCSDAAIALAAEASPAEFSATRWPQDGEPFAAWARVLDGFAPR